MEDALQQLKAHTARIVDLARTVSLLNWDQETTMPPGGVQSRAEQIGTLQGLIHEFYVDEKVGRMLEALEPLLDELPYDSDEAALIRYVRREHHRRTRVPTDLVVEIYRTAGLAKEAWKEARAQDRFGLFEPLLEQIVALLVKKAACFPQFDNPYDALLDEFEPGLSHATIAGVFDALKPRLIALVRGIAAHQDAVDASILQREVPAERQIAFGREVVAQMGYDFTRGRLDLSAHPFTSGPGYGDTRITTRVVAGHLPACLMATIHEAGHGMHGQNIHPALRRTPLGLSSSLAISESQSRFYENVIGRSRPFWRHFYPKLQAAFAPALDDVDLETFYRALNVSRPSLIRVEADEVTYGLHIMLRFELENDLINGRVRVADLPQAWNARMEDYLGVVPPNDALGVLQDIHWSQAYIGYFPDYLLGSILAAQLWEKMLAEQPGTLDEIEAGRFEGVLAWTREHVMQHGRKFTFPELADRVVGGFGSEAYIRYLTAKYGEIYGL